MMTEEEIVDRINNVIASQGVCKRIIIWQVRQLNELRKLEEWLKDEQGRFNQAPKETRGDKA